MIGFTNTHLDPDTVHGFTPETNECTMCGADEADLTPLDGEHVCAACFEADSCVPAVYGNGPTPSPVYARIARQEAVEADTADVLAHLLSYAPLRFDARAKMEQAEAYTLRAGGSALAIPTKLANVSLSQPAIAKIAGRMEAEGTAYLPCRIFVGETLGGRPEIVILAETEKGKGWTLQGLGFIQDKHAAWLAPLVASGAVRVYVTAVTGGTADKPTRGVNVVLAGCADALRRTIDAAALDAMREDAYGSGRVAVEAAL